MIIDDMTMTNVRQAVAREHWLHLQGVDLQLTCSMCPTQYEGTVGGYFIYYRSRFDEWRVTIAATLDDAVGETGNWWTFEGADDYYGVVPQQIALLQIWQAVKAWQVASKQKSE